ncbi:hypothetical protein BTVI_83781 [Pitangus sulphuratus]|nr:hypothetical protein BTVI_83781 [Pitangus sulphuratus]
MAKIHGNIFTLWFGWAPVVVLNGFQAVKDGMTTHPEDVSGRLVSPFFRAMAKGKGIMLATGHTWKQQRRFALRTLRNLGLGKKGLEHRVQEEAHYLVAFFASMRGKPLDPSFSLVHSVSNVICAVVFGHRFSREDETFHELIRATEHLFKFGGSFIHHLYEIFPWLMCRLPGPHKKALACYDVLSNFTRREIRMHTERGTPDELQDFIDFYLAHIEKSKDEPRSTYNEDNMVYSINDLFLGGSETTSTTLNWGLLYMVAYPDIQEKVQKELDAVLGPSKIICYEDRRELPYTNAVVHEIQRFSNIISVGMPRVCVRNTTLLGFPLKKGTIVLPNIASSLYDPEQWETPRQFNPGHFLDKDGNFVSQEAFLPFSVDFLDLLVKTVSARFLDYKLEAIRSCPVTCYLREETDSLLAMTSFQAVVESNEFFKLRKACKQFPPGPTPLPLLGNLVHLNFRFHRDLLMELAKTHGNIYTLWFGWTPVIILNGFQAVKDGMTMHPDDVSGRMVSPFFRAMAKGKGIILATGRSWKQQRRFGIMTLRSLGMGKKGLEHRVQEEASHLVEFFVNLKVFGYHFSDEDKTFHEMIHATENLFRFAGSFFHQMYEILPWLMCRLPGPHKKALACYDVLSSFARKEVRRHVERGIPAEPQDFIDFYLAEMEKSKDGVKPKYDEDNLVYVINDLFLGGSETSSTTLYWGLLYMVVNPDIQEKVQKELDAVLGPSQLICYEDRRKLPYTNAVVHEIQRFSNIVFVGMPRVCVRNTTLLGFPVKRGTIVIPNIGSVLYDPEEWETPRQFNPGHFLDKEGNFIPREAFLPFSAGRAQEWHKVEELGMYCPFQPLQDPVHQPPTRQYKEAYLLLKNLLENLAEEQETPSFTFG